MKEISKATCQRCGQSLKFVENVEFVIESEGTEYAVVKGFRFKCELCGVIHTIGNPSIVLAMPKKEEVICP